MIAKAYRNCPVHESYPFLSSVILEGSLKTFLGTDFMSNVSLESEYLFSEHSSKMCHKIRFMVNALQTISYHNSLVFS